MYLYLSISDRESTSTNSRALGFLIDVILIAA